MDIVFFIINFIMGLGSLALMYCAFMLVRNNRVYKIRTRILEEKYSLYRFLPTYEDMLYSFRPMKFEYWVNYCEDREFEQS